MHCGYVGAVAPFHIIGANYANNNYMGNHQPRSRLWIYISKQKPMALLMSYLDKC